MIIGVLKKRGPLALVTLFILSLIVFFGGQLLPGDVGRAVLGPLADSRAVALFDHRIGVDRPIIVQYWDWISHFMVGDMGYPTPSGLRWRHLLPRRWSIR